MFFTSVILATLFFLGNLHYMSNTSDQLLGGLGTVTIVFIHMQSLFPPDSLDNIPDAGTGAKLVVFSFAFVMPCSLIFIVLPKIIVFSGSHSHDMRNIRCPPFGGLGTAATVFIYTCAQAKWRDVAHSHSIGELLLYSAICTLHACTLLGIILSFYQIIEIILCRERFMINQAKRFLKDHEYTHYRPVGNFLYQKSLFMDIVRLFRLLRQNYKRLKHILFDLPLIDINPLSYLRVEAEYSEDVQKLFHRLETETVRHDLQKDSKQSQEVKSFIECSPGIETKAPHSSVNRDSEVSISGYFSLKIRNIESWIAHRHSMMMMMMEVYLWIAP